MTNQEETVFTEINWENRIADRLKKMDKSELMEIDNCIDFIFYKRIASINNEEKRIEEILKLKNTDFIALKKGLSEVKKYPPTGSILMEDAIDYLTRKLQVLKEDASLIIYKLISLKYVGETGNGNIRIK